MTRAERSSEEQAQPTRHGAAIRHTGTHSRRPGRQPRAAHRQPESSDTSEPSAPSQQQARATGAAAGTGESGALGQLAEALFPAREELPRVPQQARSREKRDEILRAAATLFVERSYASTTSDDIASAAGVSVGTFYNYFRNKRQALVTLVIERLEDIFGNLQLARLDFSAGDHHRANIREAIVAAMGGSQHGLRRVWMELMSLEPELVPYQQIIRRYVLTQLEASLRQARDRGETWPDLDVEATALAIFSLIDTIGLRADPERQLSTERIIDTLTNIVCHSVFPPETGDSTTPTRGETKGTDPR